MKLGAHGTRASKATPKVTKEAKGKAAMSRDNSIPEELADGLRMECVTDRTTGNDTIILYRHRDDEGDTCGWVVIFKAHDTGTCACYWYPVSDFDTAIEHYNQD